MHTSFMHPGRSAQMVRGNLTITQLMHQAHMLRLIPWVPSHPPNPGQPNPAALTNESPLAPIPQHMCASR